MGQRLTECERAMLETLGRLQEAAGPDVWIDGGAVLCGLEGRRGVERWFFPAAWSLRSRRLADVYMDLDEGEVSFRMTGFGRAAL